MREPEAPRGWPMAIAPPQRFVFAISSPSSFAHARNCGAAERGGGGTPSQATGMAREWALKMRGNGDKRLREGCATRLRDDGYRKLR